MTVDVSKNTGSEEIMVNSNTISAPYPIDYYENLKDQVILSLAIDLAFENPDPDFELPEPGRNVVSINSDGILDWVISEAPRASQKVETNYYEYLFSLDSNLYARDIDKFLYEIDPTTGEVHSKIGHGQFPIGGKRVGIDGWVNKVLNFGDRVVLMTGEGDRYQLFGFAKNGDELWRAEKRRGMIYKDGELLIEKRTRGPHAGMQDYYLVDKDTGERISEIEVEYKDGSPTYVSDISDED